MWYIVHKVYAGEDRDWCKRDYVGPFDLREEAEAKAFGMVIRHPELSGMLEIVYGIDPGIDET